MGEEIVNSNEREVLVYRDGAQLKTGDNFIPGEILHVALSSVKGQYMFEVENGGFVAGACDNKRTTNTNKAELEMPTESSDRNVKIVAAWSEEYGKVKLSSPFLLTTMRDKYNSEDWHKDLMVDLLEKQLSSGEGLDPLLWDWNNTESVRQIRSHMQERRDITKSKSSTKNMQRFRCIFIEFQRFNMSFFIVS